jgi:hypothetical protein
MINTKESFRIGNILIALLAFLLSPFAISSEWSGPYTIASVSSSAESCGSGCGSFYRLRVKVNEQTDTGCDVTDQTQTFVYYSSTVNAWGNQWSSLLMAAEAQGLEVMIFEKGTCSSIGSVLLGVKLLTD